jgi:hypothetical protein
VITGVGIGSEAETVPIAANWISGESGNLNPPGEVDWWVMALDQGRCAASDQWGGRRCRLACCVIGPDSGKARTNRRPATWHHGRSVLRPEKVPGFVGFLDASSA